MVRKSIRVVLADFPVAEHMRVLGPDDPNYVYRREDGWRNGI